MLLRNGGNFIGGKLTYHNNALPSNTLRDINGDWNLTNVAFDNSAVMPSYRPTGSTSSQSGVTLICGNGTSDVAVDDYQLGNAYDDTEFTSTGSINSANGIMTITATFNNISGMSKTITEIGVLWHWYYGRTGEWDYLIARIKVPERTVENGATATFTYEIDFANV